MVLCALTAPAFAGRQNTGRHLSSIRTPPAQADASSLLQHHNLR
jgi:hypothetical protein